MAPAIRPGDVVVLVPDAGPPGRSLTGQIVQVDDPAMATGTYLHRVLRENPTGQLTTKGDANRDPDPHLIARDRIRGRARLVVPRIGLPIVWLTHQHLTPVGLFAVLTWIAGVAALTPLPPAWERAAASRRSRAADRARPRPTA